MCCVEGGASLQVATVQLDTSLASGLGLAEVRSCMGCGARGKEGDLSDV